MVSLPAIQGVVMSKSQNFAIPGRVVAACALSLFDACAAQAADVVRHSLGPESNFPIARAVEVPAGKTIYFHSGMTPAPLDAKAAAGTPEYWGDTKTQTLSVFNRIGTSLKALNLGFGDVVAMTVYLV